MFKIGQRVVCIVDGPWTPITGNTPPAPNQPLKGTVYTIREIIDCPSKNLALAGRFEELINPNISGMDQEYLFCLISPCGIHNFRPCRDTDISIFTAMLLPSPNIIKILQELV